MLNKEKIVVQNNSEPRFFTFDCHVCFRLRHPQERVLPLRKDDPRTTTLLPQSQRQSQESSPLNRCCDMPVTVNRPNRCPVKSITLVFSIWGCLSRSPQSSIWPDFNRPSRTTRLFPQSQTQFQYTSCCLLISRPTTVRRPNRSPVKSFLGNLIQPQDLVRPARRSIARAILILPQSHWHLYHVRPVSSIIFSSAVSIPKRRPMRSLSSDRAVRFSHPQEEIRLDVNSFVVAVIQFPQSHLHRQLSSLDAAPCTYSMTASFPKRRPSSTFRCCPQERTCPPVSREVRKVRSWPQSQRHSQRPSPETYSGESRNTVSMPNRWPVRSFISFFLGVWRRQPQDLTLPDINSFRRQSVFSPHAHWHSHQIPGRGSST